MNADPFSFFKTNGAPCMTNRPVRVVVKNCKGNPLSHLKTLRITRGRTLSRTHAFNFPDKSNIRTG